MKSLAKTAIWLAVGLLGAGALASIAFHRGEPINATWFVVAAVCCYAVAYRFYSAFIAAKLLALDNTRATPAERRDDGRDFVPTNKWVLFGHYFAAIAGPGPADWANAGGGAIWIFAGNPVAGLRKAALGGCVQDFVILFCSIRRDGKTLGQMVREEVSVSVERLIAQLAVLAIMVILLASVALIIVNALEILALGHLYPGDDGADRNAPGRVLAIFSARSSAGGFGDWRGPDFSCSGGGAMGRGFANMVPTRSHWAAQH